MKTTHTPGDTTDITIEIPKLLYDLITKMAANANRELKTNVTANELISKLIVQYFGTRNSIDIMTYSATHLNGLLAEQKAEINELSEQFTEITLKLDDVAARTNKLFHQVIDKLETLN